MANERKPLNERSLLFRSFAILNAFSGDGRRLTLADLVERTGLPKATAHRLAGQLVELGALQRVDDWYQLGVRLMELAGLVPLQHHLREVAVPFLHDLFAETRETVHLGVLDGSSVVYVDRVDGHRRANVPTRIGFRMPAYCTGLGKALLAFAPQPLIDRVIANELVALTPRTIVVPSVLREELRQVRATGVAYDREENQIGVACVAAAVVTQGGGAVVAISVTGPVDRVLSHGMENPVKRAANGLAKHLNERSYRLLGVAASPAAS